MNIKSSSFTVAHFGVFDIENYGDLLFPEILLRAFSLRDVPVDIVCFSPLGGSKPLDPSGKHVCKISDFHRVHAYKKFDLLIVGGGSLIHFNRLWQINNISPNANSFQEYSIYETWVFPSLFSARYRIPLFWNAPGVPFSFHNHEKYFARQIIETCSYISVRNLLSASNLVNLGVDSSRIVNVPDTAMSLSRYYPIASLPAPSIASLGASYIVVHLNRHLPLESLELFAKLVNEYARSNGYAVILLPLAKTHNDASALDRLHKLIDVKSIYVDKCEEIEQVISIIAHSDLYIGVSYHGAITALSYGKKAIAYNYMKYDKTWQLFSELGIPELCVDTIEGVDACLRSVAACEVPVSSLYSAKEKVDTHFDFIVSHLLSSSRALDREASVPVYSSSFSLADHILSNLLVESLAEYKTQASKNSFYEEKIAWLESRYEYTSACISEYSDQVVKNAFYEEKIAWLESRIECLSEGISEITKWCHDYCNPKLSAHDDSLASLKSQISGVSGGVECCADQPDQCEGSIFEASDRKANSGD